MIILVSFHCWGRHCAFHASVIKRWRRWLLFRPPYLNTSPGKQSVPNALLFLRRFVRLLTSSADGCVSRSGIMGRVGKRSANSGSLGVTRLSNWLKWYRAACSGRQSSCQNSSPTSHRESLLPETQCSFCKVRTRFSWRAHFRKKYTEKHRRFG